MSFLSLHLKSPSHSQHCQMNPSNFQSLSKTSRKEIKHTSVEKKKTHKKEKKEKINMATKALLDMTLTYYSPIFNLMDKQEPE